MTFTLDGEPVMLPPGWPIEVRTSNLDQGVYRIFVKREGRLIPLSEVLVLRELMTKHSRSVPNRPRDDI